jgi:hypothetical protein
MDRKSAVLLPILVVLFIISLALAAGAFYLYQKEQAQNAQLQEKIADLENRQRLTEGKLEDSKKLASELQLKLQETKTKLDSLIEELNKEKSAHTEAINQLEQYKSDLAQQKSLRQDLESQLKAAQDEGKKIKEQLKIIQQQKVELEQKIKNAQVSAGGVELGKVVVNNEPPVAVVESSAKDKSSPSEEKADKKATPLQKKSLEGKVIVVNKEFNFVVINLGSKDGVKVADVFLISRDNKSIGEIKIEKVHDSMSAAGFAAELKDRIQENDKVTLKSK